MRAIDLILHDVLSENLLVVADTPLVTEMLGHSQRDVARHVFQVFRKQTTEAAIRNIPALLAALAHRNDRWRRLVIKSYNRRGRCPKKHRTRLRGLLAAQHVADQQVVLPRLLEDRSHLSIRAAAPLQVSRRFLRAPRVVATPASTKITGVEALVSALNRCREYKSIVVEIPDDHIYLPGLVVLEAWRLLHHVTISIEGSPSTRRYLARMNFSESSTPTRMHLTAAENPPYSLALHSIDDEPAEALAGRLADICNAHGYLGQDAYNALVIAFSELIENVNRHAGNPKVATIGAQYYPAQRKLTITLADCGIGIRESFVQGHNDAAKRRLKHGENALRLAISPLVTSKPVRSAEGIGHSGFGLYIVSELTLRNGGTFRLMSGSDSLTLYKRQVRDNSARRSELVNSPYWQGTLISLLLHLDNLLPIGEVYRTLPPPKDVGEEDFFSP
jgi:hypothetical protein